MEELVIATTKPKEVLDITGQIQDKLKERNGADGLCHLFLMHTSAALTTADLDEGTDLDMLDAFELVVPDLQYRHPHNPRHVKYHILASITGPSLTVPFEKGELTLGPWQRIVLIEFNGPRERTIAMTIV